MMKSNDVATLDRLEQAALRVEQAQRVLLHMADTPHQLEAVDMAAVLTILEPVAPTLHELMEECAPSEHYTHD